MENVLIAVAAVGAIGLIAGVILALAGKFFAVPVDEKVIKIREALPGANCGGCGYSGCDGYAEAVKNGAPCTLCAPGGSETAAKLAKIMGVAAESVEKKTAVVLCRGFSNATVKRFDYEGTHSCRAVNLVQTGDKSCTFGCLGYGDCVSVCEQDAIRIIDGVARIDKNLCIACGKCVKACPRSIIELLPETTAVPLCKNTQKGVFTMKVCQNGCIGCMKCVKTCPNGAVEVKDFRAVIDYQKCTACGLCAEACPKGVIAVRG